MDGISTAKVVCFHKSITELHMCDYFSSCIVWLAGFFGLHDALLCALIVVVLLSMVCFVINLLQFPQHSDIYLQYKMKGW